MEETCTKAGRFYRLGFVATAIVGCGLFIGAYVLADIVTDQQRHGQELEIRTRVIQAMAIGVVSWKVQHGSLPDAQEGKVLLEKVRKFPTARPLSEQAADRMFEDLLRGPMKLTYEPKGEDRFTMTAVGPEGWGSSTVLFESDGTPVPVAKEASDE